MKSQTLLIVVVAAVLVIGAYLFGLNSGRTKSSLNSAPQSSGSTIPPQTSEQINDLVISGTSGIDCKQIAESAVTVDNQHTTYQSSVLKTHVGQDNRCYYEVSILGTTIPFSETDIRVSPDDGTVADCVYLPGGGSAVCSGINGNGQITESQFAQLEMQYFPN